MEFIIPYVLEAHEQCLTLRTKKCYKWRVLAKKPRGKIQHCRIRV